MKKFPRIYSISTVGIRNHNNIHLLINAIRTDFTGESGTGKSLIGADIPQLILTGGKFYKSATKPKGDIPRDLYSIVSTNKEYGYALINLEVAPGKFIVIGVMIRKSPRQLHPFIIQGNMGIDPEKTYKFKPLNKILWYDHFIEDGRMLLLDDVKKKLDEHDIYLTSYFRKVSDYHKLLFQNKILHLDLSTDEDLQKQYANTLQSLARGEDIETSGIKFKKFLFHYDNEVANKFAEESERIMQDHQKYLEGWNAFTTLARKKEYLVELVNLKADKKKIFEEHLTKETEYYYQQLEIKENSLKKALDTLLKTKLELLLISKNKITNILITSTNVLQDKIKNFNLNKKKLREAIQEHNDYAKLLETIEEQLGNSRNIVDKHRILYEKVSYISNKLMAYNSIKNLKDKYATQNIFLQYKLHIENLDNSLKRRGAKELFENSEYCKSFMDAVVFYSSRLQEIDTSIKNIEKFKSILSFSNTDTFAGWAIKQNKLLNHVQEAVIFHFASLPLTDSEGIYIPEPDTLLEQVKNQISETTDSFIINLSGLFYKIPKRENYIFSDPSELKNEIKRIGESFNVKLEELKQEYKNIELLNTIVRELAYSEEYVSAFKHRDELESFTWDNSLNLTEEQLNERIIAYENDLKLPLERRIETEFNNAFQRHIDLQHNKKNYSLNSNQQLQNINSFKEEIIKIRLSFREHLLERIKLKLKENTIIMELQGWMEGINIRDEYFDNVLDNKEFLFNNIERKVKNLNPVNEDYADILNQQLGGMISDIKSITNTLPLFKINFENKKRNYESYFRNVFESNNILEKIELDSLNTLNINKSKAIERYETRYEAVITEYKEYLSDNPKIIKHQHDLDLLITELIPSEIISNKNHPEESLKDDIEKKLSVLNRQIHELNVEEAKKLYYTVSDLKKIVTKQIDYLEKVKALLKDFNLANYHKATIQWIESPDYNIKWIDALNRDIKELNLTDNLFGEKSVINAYQLLEEVFKKYCPNVTNARADEILNPYNYYTAKALIEDPSGTGNPGSTGQNYGLLALLCIAKLSIIEGRKLNRIDDIQPGIRILPIDEVAGLGENFDMLYEIAQKLDYQIFTMTITANDLNFEDGKQYYYQFIKSSDKNNHEYNDGVLACFSKDNLIEDIENFFPQSILLPAI